MAHASFISFIKRPFAHVDRPPKAKTRGDSYALVAAPAVMLMLGSVFAVVSSVGMYQDIETAPLWSLALGISGVGFGVIAMLSCGLWLFRQLRHWGYLDAIHAHSLKLQADWEAGEANATRIRTP